MDHNASSQLLGLKLQGIALQDTSAKAIVLEMSCPSGKVVIDTELEAFFIRRRSRCAQVCTVQRIMFTV